MRVPINVQYLFYCNLLLGFARCPEGDLAILSGQGGEAAMEISTRDITMIRD